ncbi:hypothetical protein KW784_01610 [Candidatus Parcubacteria bacterium]|nr:hypothetical protein [Candidatus Parcubacteria bacterium]
MKRETEIIIISTLFVLMFGLVSSLLLKNRPVALTEEWHGSWSCTADTYDCPDGTGVGRVPPYCHFAECPN